jgi:hypothetical protein
MGRFGGMWNSKCGMRNEVVGNAERRVLGLVLNNSELRTYNSELGKAGDSELITQNSLTQWALGSADNEID